MTNNILNLKLTNIMTNAQLFTAAHKIAKQLINMDSTLAYKLAFVAGLEMARKGQDIAVVPNFDIEITCVSEVSPSAALAGKGRLIGNTYTFYKYENQNDFVVTEKWANGFCNTLARQYQDNDTMVVRFSCNGIYTIVSFDFCNGCANVI